MITIMHISVHAVAFLWMLVSLLKSVYQGSECTFINTLALDKTTLLQHLFNDVVIYSAGWMFIISSGLHL